jgi:hypothetical protein
MMPRTTSISIALFVSLGAAACSSSVGPAGTGDAATTDTGQPDRSTHDARSSDTGTKDTGARDVSVTDARTPVDTGASETGPSLDAGAHDSAPRDGASDGGYPICSMTWLDDPALPQVDGGAILAVPPLDGGVQLKVLLHGQVKTVDAGGSGGTQGYKCEAADAGGGTDTYSWQKIGPEAKLDDCNGTFIIEHTPSEAGATRPQWASQIDTSIVVGETIHSVTVNAAAIPWLLLGKASSTGTGLLEQVLYVQRFNTSGGLPTPSNCNSTTVGTTVEVPYTADYYFYGPGHDGG